MAVEPLRTLVAAGHEVAVVVTRADKRRGRGGAPSPTPVKAAATELGLTVTDRLEEVLGAGAELGVMVAYGRIVPAGVLDALPMVNLHFSLLPRWRGAAPVERAILEGDAETGVCLMAVEAGLDTGPVYDCAEVGIGEGETADELRARLVELGCGLLEEHLVAGAASLPLPRPQVGPPTYAEKIRSGELEIDWAEPALRIGRLVRLGRAWTTWRGQRLGVLAAEARLAGAPDRDGPDSGTLVGPSVVAGGGSRLDLVSVQPEGRRPMAAVEWLRGARPRHGERLGS